MFKLFKAIVVITDIKTTHNWHAKKLTKNAPSVKAMFDELNRKEE